MESNTICNLKLLGVLEEPDILLVCERVFLVFTLVREILAIIHLIHNLYETHFNIHFALLSHIQDGSMSDVLWGYL